MTVSVTGVYVIRSISSIDAYGSLYQSSFNPLNPSANRVLQNNDDGGREQFLINTTLQAGITYVLVFTTNMPNVQGSFTVTVTGPSRVGLTRMDESSTVSLATSTTTTKAAITTSEWNIKLH